MPVAEVIEPSAIWLWAQRFAAELSASDISINIQNYQSRCAFISQRLVC